VTVAETPSPPSTESPSSYLPSVTESTSTSTNTSTSTAPPPSVSPTVTETVTTVSIQNNPFLYQGDGSGGSTKIQPKKYIVLNKDLQTENLDPPQDYGEHDGTGKSQDPQIQLRPYEEVATSDKWSIDSKVFGKGIQAAVDAHQAHAQGAAMLKAQCNSKLCNFPDDY